MNLDNDTLTFSNISDPVLWFQAYCLNPPADACPFGPCPNTDVTGIGQQVAVFISSTVLLVALVYSPSDVEQAIYPYLVSIYALLISSLISLLQSKLTQNDAIFVFVMVGSPATLYLWASFLFALLYRRTVPFWIGGRLNRIHGLLPCFAVLGSFFLWFAMVLIVIRFGHKVPFSQKACNKNYGLRGWITLIWPIPQLIQLVPLIIGLNNLTMKITNDQPTLEPDLLHSTHDTWLLCLPELKTYSQLLFLFLLSTQISLTFPEVILNLPYGNIAPPVAVLVLIIIDLTRYCRQRRGKTQYRILSSQNSTQKKKFCVTFFGYGLIFSLLLCQVWSIVRITTTSMAMLATLPFTQERGIVSQIFVVLQMVICATAFVLSTEFAVFKSLPMQWSLLVLFYWTTVWANRFTMQKAPGSWLEKQKYFWHRMCNCGEYLIFNLIIMIPTSSWINAVLVSDSAISKTVAFGQLFSIFVSIVPTWTFFSLCWTRRYDIMDAVSMRETNIDRVVIPQIYVIPPENSMLQISTFQREHGIFL